MGSTARLQVARDAGGRTETCELCPEPELQSRHEDAGTVWQAHGDHAGFVAKAPATGFFPAGWYELRVHIDCVEGKVVLPELRLFFAPGAAAGHAEFSLPEPDAQGWIRALVVFKFPVCSLRFCPSVWAARFRLAQGSLRRVTRCGALWRMLTVARPWRRSLNYVRGVLRDGLTTATDRAFADYLRLLRPLGLEEYDIWVRKYDTFTPSRLDDLRQRVEAMAGQGEAIAVLLRVGGGAMDRALHCIEGMLGQAWPYWELHVVADISSAAGAGLDGLRRAAASDERIRLQETQGRLGEACNAVLGGIEQGHVVVLDATCLPRRHALLEVVETLRDHPEVQWAYSDEDRLDAAGRRSWPFFKPDWNPDLLHSCNYMGRFAVLRTDLVRRAGGYCESIADPWHDLYLRCAEHVSADHIRHLPRILWHDMSPNAKAVPASGDAEGADAVRAHLLRQGADPALQVHPQPCVGYRVRWPLLPQAPRISLIVPTRDRVELLRACVESIFERSTWPAYEIVVVDNGSIEPGTLAYFAQLQRDVRVRVLSYDREFNYPAINNFAVDRCDSELICLLNNDVEVITPDWLQEMAGHALRPGVGAVGAMLYYPDDTIQHAGVVVGLHGVADHCYAGQPRGIAGHGGRARVAQNLSAVTAACLMVRRQTYLQVGGLDERLAVAFNDVDFCLRLTELGYRNVWTPHAELYHHESASRGSDHTPERQARYADEIRHMRERWPDMIAADPAFNPNLSLDAPDFRPAFPPRDRNGWIRMKSGALHSSGICC